MQAGGGGANSNNGDMSAVQEFIDPVFSKISQKRSFSVIENERFGLFSEKTESINSGIGQFLKRIEYELGQP
jgi:hypothetical protein